MKGAEKLGRDEIITYVSLILRELQ